MSNRLRGPLEISRSGGIAGYDDHIVVHPTGRVERVRGADAVGAQVDAATLEQFAGVLAALESTQPERPDIGADRMTYDVRYQGRRLHFDAMTNDPRLTPLRDAILQLLPL